MKNYEFVCFFFFVDWYCYSIGFHVCLKPINLEIHLPFGFIRIGLSKKSKYPVLNADEIDQKTFGIQGNRFYCGL